MSVCYNPTIGGGIVEFLVSQAYAVDGNYGVGISERITRRPLSVASASARYDQRPAVRGIAYNVT